MAWRTSRSVRRGVAGLVVAALAATACGDDDNDTGGPGSDDAAPPEGMVHVHGLGINPADDRLYVATHYGLFRVDDEGGAELLGDVQDIMGFTVAGEDRFLGSGHPGVEMATEGVENPLGLIESDDGGESWESQSLSGEADFHALAYAHDQIYGWNATGSELLVSTDGQEWESRAELLLASLAVDPEDPERLVATVPEGVSVSTDGGRTWEPTTGEDDADAGDDPGLFWLSWDEDGGLWAAAEDGGIYRAEGDPADGIWEEAGAVDGVPTALLAEGDAVYVAFMGEDDPGATTIVVSTDEADTWETLYHGP